MFVSVKIQIDGSTAIPWTITTANVTDTLRDLFDTVIDVGESVGHVGGRGVALRVEPRAAYIGTSRTTTARAAVDISKTLVTEICGACGNFVCFLAERVEDDRPINDENQQADADASPSTSGQQTDAMSVLMAGAARLAKQSHIPEEKSVAGSKRTNLVKLHNDIIELLHSIWQNGRMGSPEDAANFVESLQHALWYIDGHHSTLKDRVKFPKLLDKFDGYVRFSFPCFTRFWGSPIFTVIFCFTKYFSVHGHADRTGYRNKL